jgi:hypothetical protein
MFGHSDHFLLFLDTTLVFAQLRCDNSLVCIALSIMLIEGMNQSIYITTTGQQVCNKKIDDTVDVKCENLNFTFLYLVAIRVTATNLRGLVQYCSPKLRNIIRVSRIGSYIC